MSKSIRAIEALHKVRKEMKDVEIPRWPDGKGDATAITVKNLCLEVVQANLAQELDKP